MTNSFLDNIVKYSHKEEHLSDRPTVLVVEDDPMVSKLLCTVLTRVGWNVLEAADAEEAWNIYSREQKQINLLIVDIVLPHGYDGIAVVEGFKSRHVHIPYLYTSGYAEEIIPEEVYRNGHFLPKPFTPDKLYAKIREVLEQDG